MSLMDLGHIDNDVEVLNTVEVPGKYFNRVLTGVTVLDEVFGGQEMPGILPGASILFTGFPGSGKSTMALQIADLLQKVAGRSVLYNATEENKFMTKMRADRLSLYGNFCISSIGSVDGLIKYCVENKIEVVFQDSLQTLSFGDLSGNKLIKAVGNRLAKFASDTGTTVFIIGQITKSGEFAGPMQIKHAVDAHCHLSFNKDTGNRVFELMKNRFGPAMVPYEFFMSANGLDFKQAQDLEENMKRKSAQEKKEKLLGEARRLLLSGVALSGYSFEELPALVDFIKDDLCEDVGGGYWRGILNKAVAELERENNRFTKFRENRREHVRMEV